MNELLQRYESIRLELAKLTYDHDRLELDTKIGIATDKLNYEQEAHKSTEAKTLAELEHKEASQALLELEHQIAKYKTEKQILEYQIQYGMKQYE